jgi:hypothetical protein
VNNIRRRSPRARDPRRTTDNSTRLNNWWLSWNPDDAMYYVCSYPNGIAAKVFFSWHNATAWARKNNVNDYRLPADAL